VEADLADAGILFEIGGDVAEFEAHGSGSCAVSGLCGFNVPAFALEQKE
jgi:hypothetical protein